VSRAGERERLLEMASELANRLSTVIRDGIPPEAQRHLSNATQELLTALVVIYEHQLGARRPAQARRPAAASRRRPARRVNRIKVD
jgi:hypothetical protein